jgi:hypothetical protein
VGALRGAAERLFALCLSALVLVNTLIRAAHAAV